MGAAADLIRGRLARRHPAGPVQGRVIRRSLAAGGVLGLLALPVAYAVAPPPDGGSAVGLALRMTAAPTGELSVSPATVLDRAGLAPGQAASGRATVRNLTAVGLTVFLRARPTSDALDDTLRVRVRFGSEVRYEGDLGGLRDGTWLGLRRGRQHTLRLEARVTGGDGWRGLDEDVALVLEPVPRLSAGFPGA